MCVVCVTTEGTFVVYVGFMLRDPIVSSIGEKECVPLRVKCVKRRPI